MKIPARFLCGLPLFLFVGFVFFTSPIHYLTDSSYSLLMDEAILRHGTPNMIAYRVPHGQGRPFNSHGYLWTIDLVHGRLLYQYPWGAPLLSLPAVALFDVGGFGVTSGAAYNGYNELQMQTVIASLVSAAAVWLFFDAAVSMLPIGWALAIALGAAFGTPVWSSASRSLYPQTWSLLLVSAAIWLLLKSRLRPLLLGTLMAWACFARPQELPAAALIGIYVLVEHGWPRFLAYAITGAAWAAGFAGMMLFFFGHLTPPIYAGGLDFPYEFIERLGGILLSPSRGLLVFAPIVLMPMFLVVRYWQVLPRRRLALIAMVAILAQFVLTASWECWWGGRSYGPRLLLGTIPWFVLLATIGVRALLDDRQLTMQNCITIVAAAMLLLTLSVAMNAVGAVAQSGYDWNKDLPLVYSPRLWDWRHPQWLAWAQSG